MTEKTTYVMVKILEKFCNDHCLPQLSADELIMIQNLTDFQLGFLVAYCRIWDAMDL